MTETQQPTHTPHNIYIGYNFSVRLTRTFKLSNMIQHDVFNGVVHNDFETFKNLGKMTLSLSAQKIKDMPNAGGDSVASEVLSYEVLHKCFGAKLLKVSTCILMTTCQMTFQKLCICMQKLKHVILFVQNF